ncbi:MAG: M28 family peptidase [Thermanaerothrix sp.]|nr:M28 family peptidase [Thermanaerothrix sp.]
MPIQSPRFRLFLTILLIAGMLVVGRVMLNLTQPPQVFNAQRAYRDVQDQIALGARTPGSLAHAALQDYIVKTLQTNGWMVETQPGSYEGKTLVNLIGKRGSHRPWIILAAHYDSRLRADNDPDPELRNQPVPGANDGASGVAILLELARTLPKEMDKEIWLVFFDAEDQGEIPGWEWIMGSRYFVSQLERHPEAVVIVDMVGDANLRIPKERNSDPQLIREIWSVAHELGYQEYFIDTEGLAILDDHVPFLEQSIPAVDLIDFDYPYWHTTRDLPDKVSPHSLEIVGRTLYHWVTYTQSQAP